MSSQARSSREEERRLSIRTLASAASAVAAIVTSRLWAAGTPIAAAMTPVIVTIVSEMLHRPTARIAQRFTTETGALPEATGAGAPPPPQEREGMRVYRSTKTARRPLPWKLIGATAALAFVIGVAALTLPQVVAGESLVEGRPPLYGSASKDRGDHDAERRETPADPAEQPDRRAPGSTTPEEPAPETVPEQTETPPEEPPASGEPAPQTTPTPAPGKPPATP